ncbi:MAG: hypothetical protein WAR37_01450 [Candidatus Microsaccharimonas sp.]
MARLPKPGSDNGVWGNLLNEFLHVEHNDDGSLKADGSLSTKADDTLVVHKQGLESIGGTKTFLASPSIPAPTQISHAATKGYVDSVIISSAPEATGTTKGLLRLDGDLAGTADAPTVPGLSLKANSSDVYTKSQVDSVLSAKAATNHAHTITDITNLQSSLGGKEPSVIAGTTTDFYRGDKTWQPLNKAAVGLSNVDNTSDNNKPISTAVQSALNTKVDANSLSVVATSGSYSDLSNKPVIPAVSDASTTAKGVIQLAGDLGGTASAPTVPGLSAKEPSVASGTTTDFYRGDKTWQPLNKAAVGLGNVDNTSDLNKPISNSVQTALNAKASSTIAITGTNSITGGGDLTTNRSISLVNDANTPGATKYYGTDSVGTKGFFDLPASGSGTYAALGNKTIGFNGSGADYICDGVNDQVEIQQAINAVTTAGGGIIRFQAGVYDIRATITLPKNPKLKLQGAYVTKTGFGGTTLKVNTSVSPNLSAIISESGTAPALTSNADLSHVSHYDQLIFDGNDKADVGLLLLNTDHTITSECKFVGTLIGIDGQYSGDVAQSDYAGGLRVEDCSFMATNKNIRLNSHTQNWITNSWFLGGPNTHVELISCNKIHFSNNEFNSVSGQIFTFSDTASLYCGDINITGGFMNAGTGKLFWNDTRTNTSSKGIIVSGVRMVQGLKSRLFQQAKEYQGATYTNANMSGGFVTPDFNDQVILLNASAGAVNLQLPALSNAVQNIWIKAISVASTVTLTPNGSESIEAGTTFTFSEVNESVLLSPDSTRWRILENYKPSGGSSASAESVVEISSATYTVGTTTDTLLVNASSNAVVVTLPSKATKSTATKKTLVIKVINATNTVTINAAGSDQIDNSGQTSIVVNDTRAISFVANTGTRWRTYASYDTAIQQRYHDGTSGRLFMTKTAVIATAQTIIADGTGDIVYGITGTLILNNSGTLVMQSFSLLPDGSNLDITVGTSTWRFSVSTLGAFTVIRSAGTGSATITINAVWQ